MLRMSVCSSIETHLAKTVHPPVVRNPHYAITGRKRVFRRERAAKLVVIPAVGDDSRWSTLEDVNRDIECATQCLDLLSAQAFSSDLPLARRPIRQYSPRGGYTLQTLLAS